jgi:hypothetical protein
MPPYVMYFMSDSPYKPNITLVCIRESRMQLADLEEREPAHAKGGARPEDLGSLVLGAKFLTKQEHAKSGLPAAVPSQAAWS